MKQAKLHNIAKLSIATVSLTIGCYLWYDYIKESKNVKKEQQNFEYGNSINYAKIVSSFGKKIFETLSSRREGLTKKVDTNAEMKKQQISFLNRCLNL